MSRALRVAGALALAFAVWVPVLHLFVPADAAAVLDARSLHPMAAGLADRRLELLADSAARAHEVERLRQTDPEWDLMTRSFSAWGLSAIALRDPSRKASALAAVDRLIEETVALEKEHGQGWFLLPYGSAGRAWKGNGRSLFVDSEIALMMGMRRIVEEDDRWRAPFLERVAAMTGSLESAPLLLAESYPDECWLFDNSNALAAMRMADVLDGADHADLIARVVASLKKNLVDPRSGLIASSFSVTGRVKDGPEGSSIWMGIESLAWVDPALSHSQYELAHRELSRTVAGFGWAREWPVASRGASDVDSGMSIPILDASPSSSGFAFVGAAGQKDREYLQALLRSLSFGGFPEPRGKGIAFATGNAVGDAVLLYALTLGPTRAALEARAAHRGPS